MKLIKVHNNIREDPSGLRALRKFKSLSYNFIDRNKYTIIARIAILSEGRTFPSAFLHLFLFLLGSSPVWAVFLLSTIERVDLFFSKSTRFEKHNKRSGKGIFEVKRFLLKYSHLSS